MEDLEILQLVTGPTSSLILLLGGILATGRFMKNVVVPNVTRWIDAHLTQVDSLIEEHGKDREAWLSSMRECHDQGKRIEQRLDDIQERLKEKVH